MKNLFLAGAILMTTNLFASDLTPIQSFTNTSLNSAANSLIAQEVVTHSGKQKVNELKGTGKTIQELRQSAVSQALHILCPFFDDGVRIRLDSKSAKGNNNAITDFLESTSITEGDAQYKLIQKEISSINKQADVELFSGSASGNNTAGTVLGFYDIKNNEIGVFSNTNCGSDN